MILSNIDKIYQEHSFLEKIVPKVKMKTARVKRWGEDFSKVSPVEGYDGGRHVSPIFFLDKDGVIIWKVGKTWNPFWVRDESVGQALARFKLEDKDKSEAIKYAVHLLGSDLVLYKC